MRVCALLDAPEAGMLDGAGERLPGAVLAVKPDAAEGACRAPRRRRRHPGPLHRGRRADASAWRRRSAGSRSVVRAMPNTPALVGAGVSAISGGSFATSQDLAWAEEVLGAVGTVVRLPERLLDPVTGLSGSGPAYFFLVAESLIEAGVQMGLTRDVSRTLVVETMRGSAALLAETGRDPESLRAEVTSPAGTTAAGHPDARRRGRCARPSWRRWRRRPSARATCIAERLRERQARPCPPPVRTVFFLSDFGTQDEFVGVVHAVIAGAGHREPR